MGAMVLGALGFSAWAFMAATGPEHELPVPPPPSPPPRRTIGAHWYPQSSVTPLAVDVNGDGQEDLIGLAWTSRGDTPLIAVAFDGKTFEPLWQSAPFHGIWHSEITHLLLANGRVVVTDAAGDIHVLDKATGKEERTISYPAGVEIACDAEKSDVLVINASRWGSADAGAFDLSTGVAVPVPKGRECRWNVDAVKARPGVPASTSLDDKRFKAPKGVYAPSAFDAGAVVFAAGRRDSHDPKKQGGDGSEVYGIAWDAKTAKVAWQHALIDSPDVEHDQVRHTLVADDSVVTVYQAETEPRKGPWRVVAWNVATGEKQWATTLPASAEGSWLGAVGASSGRIFVVTNQGLHVLDRGSGTVLTTLERF
jgi:hypothetical protein